MKYAIRFTLPGQETMYAGLTGDGAYGFAPTLVSAELYEQRDRAERVLKNAYGPSVREHGEVIEVDE